MELEAKEKFMLVLFLDDPEKSIDFVPANWIFFDKKQNHLVTPFIPNYSKANAKLLTTLVKSESNPPNTWQFYKISVRGYAKSYAEAEEKIKDLQKEPYVYSTEDESHAKAKERAIIKSYKIKANVGKKQSLDDEFAAAAIDLEAANMNNNNASDFTAHPKKKLKPKKKSLAVAHGDDLNRSHSSLSQSGEKSGSTKPKTTYRNGGQSLSETPSDELIDSDIEDLNANHKKVTEKISPAVAHGGDSNRSLSSLSQSGEKSGSTKPKTTDRNGGQSLSETPSDELIDFNIEDSDDLRSIVLKSHRSLNYQLSQIRGELAVIKIRQIENNSVMLSSRSKNGGRLPGIDQSINTYKLGELPFQNLEEFEKFDDKLKSEKALRRDVINGISLLISSDPKHLVSSIRNVIQRFLIRDVVLKFTAVRQTNGKKVFKTDTAFYACIRDAILAEYNGTPHAGSIKEKQISDGLAAVINSAKDWDGHRQNRNKN